MESLPTIHIHPAKKHLGEQYVCPQIFGIFFTRFQNSAMAITKQMALSWMKQPEDIQHLRDLNALPFYGQDFPSADIWGLRTFHGFRNLPVKIRLHVWNLLLPQGRYVCMDSFGHTRLWQGKTVSLDPNIDSKWPLPIGLAINRESRHETLRFYHLLPYFNLWHTDQTLFRDRFVYNGRHPFCFDPQVDTAYMTMSSFILQWNQDPENRDNPSLPLYDSIERLEIQHWNWVSFGFSFLADLLAKFNEFNDNGPSLKGPLGRFTKLKELKLVYEQGGPDGDDEIAAEILEDFKCFLMQLLPIWEERGTRIVVENWNELPRIAIFESESAVSTYSW